MCEGLAKGDSGKGTMSKPCTSGLMEKMVIKQLEEKLLWKPGCSVAKRHIDPKGFRERGERNALLSESPARRGIEGSGLHSEEEVFAFFGSCTPSMPG